MANKNEYIPEFYLHPGETLSEKLEELEMGIKEFSTRTGKPEKTILAIINGKSSITSDMAVQFENVLKIPANFWLNYQKSFDEYKSRTKSMKNIGDWVKWTESFPIKDMIKKNWIEKKKSIEEQTIELLKFFGISNPKAWQNYYLNQELKVAFRISLAQIKNPHSISAWLRRGEIQASKLTKVNYSEKKFKASLPEIKSLMAKHPENFFSKLQDICFRAGVKLIYTPCISNAPVNGATRWLNGSPLIQISGRYNRNDIFWFTFFHEVGHILLHGKKEIFLEDIEYSDKDEQKEKEADNFAIHWTLSVDEEKQVIESTLTEKNIIAFAKKINTNPAMIIGRLQKKELIHYSVGRHLIQKINLKEL